MEEQSRASHKYLLLQVWCGLLTVSMVTMGAFLTTLKPNSEETELHVLFIYSFIFVWFSDMNIFEHLKSQAVDNSWKASLKSEPSTLYVNQDSIYSKRKSHYFVYAQVTFKNGDSSQRSVILQRNGTAGKQLRVLAEARGSAGSSVWVGKIIKLAENDSISLNISGTFKKENTFWGVYQLH
uniref:TNF family profile domain-containing protein n=1 Tax=Oryzias melastigma TaxID=30732 RepID=A0A3B3CJL0_ORYME